MFALLILDYQIFAWSSKYGELWPGYQAKDGSKSRLQTLTILLPSLGGCKEWQPGKMQLAKSWFFFFPLGLWIAQAAVWSILWEKDRWEFLLGIWATWHQTAATAAMLQPPSHRWGGQKLRSHLKRGKCWTTCDRYWTILTWCSKVCRELRIKSDTHNKG